MGRWHSANILNTAPASRQLWQFSADRNDFVLDREQALSPDERLPGKTVRKNWQNLWHKRLNVAWLPTHRVFLRVVEVPASEFAEIVSMIELQLDQLSPMPLNQVVWSLEMLPRKPDALQSVVVVIASRAFVEEFLGQLEGSGYVPDRLEVPMLDQLLATQPDENGVWIYFDQTYPSSALVAWWYDGQLRNLTLLSVPAGAQSTPWLQGQLAQMAWSGELEGWLTSAPKWRLVATPEIAAQWEPALQAWAPEGGLVEAPLGAGELAARSARRAAAADPKVNLLPAEYTSRYHQQFIDRLWMGGVGAVILLYVVGVLIYFGALQVLKFQERKVTAKATQLSPSYTNALQLREKVSILEEQSSLRFLALEAWKAAVDNLPEELTLTMLQVNKGQSLVLFGTVPMEQAGKVIDYNEAMSRVKINDKALVVEPHRSSAPRPGPGGGMMITWDFRCSIGNTGGDRP